MTDRCISFFQFKKPERIIKEELREKNRKNCRIRSVEVPVCFTWVTKLLSYYKPPLFTFGISKDCYLTFQRLFISNLLLIFLFLIKTNQTVDKKVPLRATLPVFSQILSSVIGQMTKPCMYFRIALSKPIIQPQVSMSLSTS